MKNSHHFVTRKLIMQFKNGQKIWAGISPKKHMKSMLNIISNCALKTVRYYYMPMRMTEVKKSDPTECWWGCWNNWHTHSLLAMLQKTVWWFLIKLNKTHTLWPSNPTSCVFIQKRWRDIKSFMWTFIIAFSVIAPN